MPKFKNITALLLSVCLTLTVSGCNNNRVNDNGSSEYVDPDMYCGGGGWEGAVFDRNFGMSSSSSFDSDVDPDYLAGGRLGSDHIEENKVVCIYNAQNEEIGQIAYDEEISFVNGCIVYMKVPENASSSQSREFWMYDIEAGQDYKLGAAECRYCASYESLNKGDHLYISVSSGEYLSTDQKLTIFDIDLEKRSMTPLLEVTDALPYDSFTIADNKLFLAHTLRGNGNADIIEYDLSEKHDQPVVHTHSECDRVLDHSVYHLYADDENLYAVRIVIGESAVPGNVYLGEEERKNYKSAYSLYLDTYDFDCNLINSVDISEFCGSHLDTDEFVKDIERRQFITYFFVRNDLVYYNNFSTTRLLGVWDDAENKISLFSDMCDFYYVISSTQRDDDILFNTRWGDSTHPGNTFYRVNSQTHEIETAQFFAGDSRYVFGLAWRDKDKILLNMNYTSDDKAESLPDRFYYLDTNDLNFNPME